MRVGVVERIAASVLLTSTVLLLQAEADQQLQLPLRKLEINKITCGQVRSVPEDAQTRILVYMNGYLDGTRRTTTWDAERTGKRIDEVLQVCDANPKSILLEVFKRAWNRLRHVGGRGMHELHDETQDNLE
jgi:HdeA/HdeB family